VPPAGRVFSVPRPVGPKTLTRQGEPGQNKNKKNRSPDRRRFVFSFIVRVFNIDAPDPATKNEITVRRERKRKKITASHGRETHGHVTGGDRNNNNNNARKKRRKK